MNEIRAGVLKVDIDAVSNKDDLLPEIRLRKVRRVIYGEE